MDGDFSLEEAYGAYPLIEEEFEALLDVSLEPRGPDHLYDLVATLALPAGAHVLDVGCGEGDHSLHLAQRFDVEVTGIDPFARHLATATEVLAARYPDLRARVAFRPGRAEALPVPDATVDLVWCRDALYHVAAVDRAGAEFRRVLRPGGRVLVYQMFATDRLAADEAAWLWRAMGVHPNSADCGRVERALAAGGLQVDECVVFGTEFGEWAAEATGKPGRKLLHAARLLRAPDRYVAAFGRSAYDTMLGDCLWHVYGMIGKLCRRAYLLSAA